MQGMAYGAVYAKVGVVANALGWSGLARLIFSFLGLLNMIWNIVLLDNLIDDWDRCQKICVIQLSARVS